MQFFLKPEHGNSISFYNLPSILKNSNVKKKSPLLAAANLGHQHREEFFVFWASLFLFSSTLLRKKMITDLAKTGVYMFNHQLTHHAQGHVKRKLRYSFQEIPNLFAPLERLQTVTELV